MIKVAIASLIAVMSWEVASAQTVQQGQDTQTIIQNAAKGIKGHVVINPPVTFNFLSADPLESGNFNGPTLGVQTTNERPPINVFAPTSTHIPVTNGPTRAPAHVIEYNAAATSPLPSIPNTPCLNHGAAALTPDCLKSIGIPVTEDEETSMNSPSSPAITQTPLPPPISMLDTCIVTTAAGKIVEFSTKTLRECVASSLLINKQIVGGFSVLISIPTGTTYGLLCSTSNKLTQRCRISNT